MKNKIKVDAVNMMKIIQAIGSPFKVTHILQCTSEVQNTNFKYQIFIPGLALEVPPTGGSSLFCSINQFGNLNIKFEFIKFLDKLAKYPIRHTPLESLITQELLNNMTASQIGEFIATLALMSFLINANAPFNYAYGKLLSEQITQFYTELGLSECGAVIYTNGFHRYKSNLIGYYVK